MILIDLSQIMFSTIFQNMKDGLNEDLARSMIFTTLLSHKKNFGQKFGAPVLAMDSRNGYWRKEIFEHYKAGRSKSREESKLDWDAIFKVINVVSAEIEECMPWKTIRYNQAEGDDIIGVLAMKYGDLPTLILSSDKDYKQLHYKKGVVQYSPMGKSWVKTTDPKRELLELIIHGDGGDGIPNILSPRDSFVTGTKQKPVTKKFKEEWFKDCSSLYRQNKERFDENQRLIDFNYIPDHIREGILQEFDKDAKGSINKLYQLFVAKRMNRMLSDIELFKVKASDYGICAEESFFQ
jgi:hypothetical protein